MLCYCCALQACLLLFKLWGGNISSRTPGDPANMFSYTGPAGIKVRAACDNKQRAVHALPCLFFCYAALLLLLLDQPHAVCRCMALLDEQAN
jgi:hypothetical protein